MSHSITQSAELKMVPRNLIRTDATTQARVNYDHSVVSEYQEQMEAGVSFPPVVVFFDGKDYWLADGNYRKSAYHYRGVKELECEVHQGTKSDAQWYAARANATHGQPRTRKDKRHAVEMALLHPNAKGMSDGAIAAHVCVPQPTVSRIRDQMVKDGRLKQCLSRTGADGRTIDTTKIGRKPDVNTATKKPSKPKPKYDKDGNTILTATEVVEQAIEAFSAISSAAPGYKLRMTAERASLCAELLGGSDREYADQSVKKWNEWRDRNPDEEGKDFRAMLMLAEQAGKFVYSWLKESQKLLGREKAINDILDWLDKAIETAPEAGDITAAPSPALTAPHTTVETDDAVVFVPGERVEPETIATKDDRTVFDRVWHLWELTSGPPAKWNAKDIRDTLSGLLEITRPER